MPALHLPVRNLHAVVVHLWHESGSADFMEYDPAYAG